MDKYSSWCGLGYKAGGILIGVGVESIGGRFRNLSHLSDYGDFDILNVRLGFGLGASVGACACLLFDCYNLRSLHETRVSDWSVNASLGPKWSDLVKGLSKYKFFQTLSKLVRNSENLKNASAKDIEKIRNGMSYIYSSADLVKKSKGPKLAIIDIPGAGVGAELSAYWTTGKIEID